MSSFQFRPLAVACTALALGAGAARADTILQTYEAPGVLNTTSSIAGGVETFDAIALGSSGFATTYGGSAFTGTYSPGAQVAVPDQYGAAAGIGHYVVTFASAGYSITLNQQANYFGYWLSALDAGNVVEFYNGVSLVGSLNAAGVLASIGSNPAYFGNPSGPFAGQDTGEPYAFVNFYDTTGSFDRIVFREDPTVGGYESDNHTVGTYRDITGTPVTPVPEPQTYALMLAGLAVVVRIARRRSAR